MKYVLFFLSIILIVLHFLPLRAYGRNVCEEGGLWTLCFLTIPIIGLVGLISLGLIIIEKRRNK